MKKNDGFTLVELVLILVLLGILGAVAVPKYFDLQDEAQQKAARLAVAEAQSRIEARFSELILNGEACSTAVEAVSKLADLDDSADEGKALFGDFSLTPVTLTEEMTTMTVKVVDGETETDVNFGTDAEPKLVLPTCADSEAPVDAKDIAEAIWKIIARDATLKTICGKGNIQCTSRDATSDAAQKIMRELKRAGLGDVTGKLWAAELDDDNLRVVVTNVTQEEANELRKKKVGSVEATVYTTENQKTETVKKFKLRDDSGVAYVDTGDIKK